jgi:DNA-binding MarR family transcriptional regulator
MDELKSLEQKKQIICDYKDRIDTLIHDQYHVQAQRLGLSLEQFHLLIEMDELMLDVPADQPSGLSIGRIAEHVGNAQNTISERVTRLEDKGLVRRVRDTADRRINRVSITEEGQNMLQEISSQASISFLKEAMDALDDDEVDQLLVILEKVLRNLEKKAGN